MLSNKDIKFFEVVGKSIDGDDIYHLETKGGLHKILKKRKKGDFRVLGSGNHRAVARVLANQVEKNISWHESLFKSEDAQLIKNIKDKTQFIESTADTHTAQAIWHTFMSTKEDTLNKIYHSLQAIAHFQAAGLDKSKALETVNNTLKKLNKSFIMDQPFDEELLKKAYEKKHKKPFPSLNE